MNIRSLTRGDGAVTVAALVLLIASFLPFFTVSSTCPPSVDSCSVSAWSPATFPMVSTVHLLAIAVVALFLAARSLPEGRKLLGIGFDQWAVVLSVVVGWSGIWSVFSSVVPDLGGQFSNGDDGFDLGAGAYLTIIFSLVLAAAGVLNATLPALKAPLLGAPSQPNPYGPQGGYGYPGGPQQGQPPYGQQPQGGYGYPGGPQPQPAAGAQPQPQPQPQPAQQAQQPAGGAPDPNFQPFWFAVPVARPLYGEDGSPQPVAELAPGTWYLAVEQRGQALVAQTQDGRRGVLQDTSGIQRG